ncbi:hypothetical protein N7539_008777 [Penicillium diatomitis]|uniref:Bacteriophage T5 Orf172 DNA-binding domain-containing protein n=1 Tax=Penicillium diatomitis TaxID=2819901 RepID=A0A9X0BLP8_9EURO|nr:uncharacterized protein N7539_008777 [Penicillium diatomitis]KAJ5471834.1 hypothetical protein N7539_008777 [Penicillium diatomitis]
MVFNPDISFFISFNDLDPSTQKQCIFFTQKGARCKSNCRDQDNQRAVELQHLLKATPVEDIKIKILSEYAQCNCFLWERAQHRDKIEDLQLLTPLAQRWLNEIRAQPVLSLNKAKSVRLARDRAPAAAASDATGKLSVFKASDEYTCHLPTSSSTFGLISNGLEDQKGYNLRTRRINSSENLAHRQPFAVTQPALSEFRRHIAEPSPGDSVYQKMLTPLKKRDFETGSLYIFDRESSPGHVKIGWTAKTVSDRLVDWSNCGYEPNLLFSLNDIPHAHRVETLTHYELIKEWRRERREIVINKTIAAEKGVGQLPVPETGKEITRLLPRAKPPKVSEAEYVVKVEQTEQSQSNDFKEISVKDFESDLLTKSEFAQEVKTTRTEVKHKPVAAKVWHMPKNISLAISPRIDLKSPHISASSLQCVKQRPDVEAKQLSGKDISLNKRSPPADPLYNLTTNSWDFPSNIEPNTQTKVLT